MIQHHRLSSTVARINVTGNVGAGKTTAAARLGDLLGLPVFSLDPIVWQPGWHKTPPAVRAPLEEELISKPGWIIDGVSKRVRAAADLILFLDTPPHVCFARATFRMLRHLRRQRPEFPPGCPEWRIYPHVSRLIWRFNSHAGFELRTEAAEDHRYRVVSGQSELDAFFANTIGED
jgi:adenylate kinase family enzyme